MTPTPEQVEDAKKLWDTLPTHNNQATEDFLADFLAARDAAKDILLAEQAEELRDIKETYANTVSQPCDDPNTVHCSCVPALRAKIAEQAESKLSALDLKPEDPKVAEALSRADTFTKTTIGQDWVVLAAALRSETARRVEAEARVKEAVRLLRMEHFHDDLSGRHECGRDTCKFIAALELEAGR